MEDHVEVITLVRNKRSQVMINQASKRALALRCGVGKRGKRNRDDQRVD